MTPSNQEMEDPMSTTLTHSPEQEHTGARTAPEPAKRLSNRDLVERLSPQLASILPPAVPLERFKTAVVADLNMLPGLSDLRVNAIAAGIIAIAQMGLEPGPSGQVGVKVEVDNDGRPRLVSFPTYKGVRELAFRTGRITSIVTGAVRPEDTFECYTDDDGQHICHRPSFSESPAHLYYAVAYGPGGHIVGLSVLRRSDVEANRAMSPYPDGDAWANFYDKMAQNSAAASLGAVLDLVKRPGDPAPTAPADLPPAKLDPHGPDDPSTRSSAPDPYGHTFSVADVVFAEMARDGALTPVPRSTETDIPTGSAERDLTPDMAAMSADPDMEVVPERRHFTEDADNWPEETAPTTQPRRASRSWSPPVQVFIDDLPDLSEEI